MPPQCGYPIGKRWLQGISFFKRIHVWPGETLEDQRMDSVVNLKALMEFRTTTVVAGHKNARTVQRRAG